MTMMNHFPHHNLRVIHKIMSAAGVTCSKHSPAQAHQYIKDSKVEICRGGRSTSAVEAIVVETIAVEVIAVEVIAVEAITVEVIALCADPGGGQSMIAV